MAGRRYILARYLVGETLKAVCLVEDIAYRCRLMKGVLRWSNLGMSTLVSQLYTSVGARYQSYKDNQNC